MERRRLPDTRQSVTRRATICGFECYITVGFHPSDDPADIAEIFLKVAKHGSEISGLLDMLAVTCSVAMQYGVPWSVLCDKMRYSRFGSGDHAYSSLCDGIAAEIDDMLARRRALWGAA